MARDMAGLKRVNGENVCKKTGPNQQKWPATACVEQKVHREKLTAKTYQRLMAKQAIVGDGMFGETYIFCTPFVGSEFPCLIHFQSVAN